MERWLIPTNIANQKLSVNLKFKIQPGHGNMIDSPVIFWQPESCWKI